MSNTDDKKHIQSAKFLDLKPQADIEGKNEIKYFIDVPLHVTVELGHAKGTFRDLLELEEGTIIELNKQAGESVDLIVNKHTLAKGEVVVIDENFGVRITEISDTTDIDKKALL